jgi:lycopene cyclase domain-containing protein
MDKHYTYLLIDCATILFPFLLSFDKKVAYYKSWKYLLFPMLLTSGFFIVWDMLFTASGVWQFNPDYITGLHIGNLPVEEWLFFLVVPYSCAFIYECLIAYFAFRQKADWGWKVLVPLALALLIGGVLNYGRDYTFYTFIFCGIAILLFYVLRNQNVSFRADVFVIGFCISIIPFFIVNGFLTAIPVVIYNDAENLGVRMYTIPFEDTFYGMLLMLGNIAGMEWMGGNAKGEMQKVK